MKCLHCAGEIADFLVNDDSPRRLFRCPRCDAPHVRQLVDRTPDGRPVSEVRLWGHPATTRRIHRIEGGRTPAVRS